MDYICTILILTSLTGWILVKEYPVLLGAAVPTGSIKRLYFKLIVAAGVIGGIFLPLTDMLCCSLVPRYEGIESHTMVMVVLSAFVTTVLLERFNLNVSIVYALIGSLEGYKLYTGGSRFDFATAGSWIAAPAVCFVLGALLYIPLKIWLKRSNIHFIRFSIIMRYAVIAGIALMAVAVGVNCGGMIVSVGRLILHNGTIVSVIACSIAALTMICFSRRISNRTDICADKYFDLTTHSVVAVIYAVSLTMLLFSWPAACGAVGLKASPLSIVTLVFGALAGVGVAQRHELVERSTLLSTTAGIVTAPLTAAFLTYIMQLVFKTERIGEGHIDAGVLVTALLLLVTVVSVNYVSRLNRQKRVTDKIVSSQQQQLYENQKALNQLEIKAILSENQSLHNSLEMKRKEIVDVALSISQQKEFLEQINDKLKELNTINDPAERRKAVTEVQQAIGQRLSFDDQIDTFYTQAEQLHKDFSVKLTNQFPDLTNQERRLATLLRLGFQSKYIATLMNITPKSVEISRYRLRRKLGLGRGDNLIQFIKSI